MNVLLTISQIMKFIVIEVVPFANVIAETVKKFNKSKKEKKDGNREQSESNGTN